MRWSPSKQFTEAKRTTKISQRFGSQILSNQAEFILAVSTTSLVTPA
jgi:hypothetical protein